MESGWQGLIALRGAFALAANFAPRQRKSRETYFRLRRQPKLPQLPVLPKLLALAARDG
jgi:hypothetical protein